MVVGQTVITGYNNQTYRINEIDFVQNASCSFNSKLFDQKSVSFVDYYKERHKQEI